jgi:hypothetical protein
MRGLETRIALNQRVVLTPLIETRNSARGTGIYA